jgi:SAM-dependent methyltransferase
MTHEEGTDRAGPARGAAGAARGDRAAPPPGAGDPTGPADPTAVYRRANRDLWDAWTRLHLRLPTGGPHYDVAAFKAGRTTLTPIERAELGDVAGQTLLHLQCHFGLDSLSWAREGAAVTGVDFSPEAVAAAARLSQELGLPAHFVCADVYDLPGVLGETFDVVFASYGVLTWLPDVPRWARVVARFVRPGGVFYLVDRHPVTRLLRPRTADSAGNPLREGYFPGPAPARAEEHGSYADPETAVWTTAYYWSHSLGEVVTALIDAGLRPEFLHEFPEGAIAGPGRPSAEPGEADPPAWFSVRARRPARAR